MTVEAGQFAIGDEVWVHAYGRWRRGTVTAAARMRVRVSFVARADGTTRDRWFRAGEQYPVLPGSYAPPITWRCERPGCPRRLKVTGYPGQTAEQLQAAHDAEYEHPDVDAGTLLGPAPADTVWVAAQRRGIEGHRVPPGTPKLTGCGRSLSYGLTTTAATARERWSTPWCQRCWPATAPATPS